MSTEQRIRPAGRLELTLESIDGRTRPVRCLTQPPLQLSRVRYDDPAEPDRAVFTLIHLGGILAGDRYELTVELGEGATAMIGTAAATQVYRHPLHSQQAQATQALALHLARNSRLIWQPEPLILFAGARFSQATRIVLAPGARLALLDVTVPGRLARGEVLQFAHFATRLEVSDTQGRCLVAERAVLEPQRQSLAWPGVLDATPVWGSLYLLGDQLDSERGCSVVQQCDQPGMAATTLPHQCGLLVRALGTTPQHVRAMLLRAWYALSQIWHAGHPIGAGISDPAPGLQDCATLTESRLNQQKEQHEHL